MLPSYLLGKIEKLPPRCKVLGRMIVVLSPPEKSLNRITCVLPALTSQIIRRQIEMKRHHDADNANEALRILGIAEPEPGFPSRSKVHAWATQAALSRPGRKKFKRSDVNSINFFTFDSDGLHWPRGTK